MLKFLLWLTYSAVLVDEYVCSSVFDQSCTCAIMNGDVVSEPMFEQTFKIAYTCDDIGKINCKNLCLSVTEGALTSENGSLLLCKNINKDIEVYISVFSRVCDFPYETSGRAYSSRLCCIDHKPVICF